MHISILHFEIREGRKAAFSQVETEPYCSEKKSQKPQQKVKLPIPKNAAKPQTDYSFITFKSFFLQTVLVFMKLKF